jgi:hypothetical protein
VHKSLPGCCGFVNICVTGGMPSFVLVECFLLEVVQTSSNARIFVGGGGGGTLSELHVQI